MVFRRFQFRKPARQKGKRRQRSAALKLLFLALRQAAKKWTMPSHHWVRSLALLDNSPAGTHAGHGEISQ
jgi:hypothetical protein